MAGKRAPRHGNLALRRVFQKNGFDWVKEMVKLYPDLQPQAKLNALQTIAKYTEIEPKAPTMTVSKSESNDSGTKQLKASIVDNLPIEEVMRLASGGSYESVPRVARPPAQSVLLNNSASELTPAPKRRAKKSGG